MAEYTSLPVSDPETVSKPAYPTGSNSMLPRESPELIHLKSGSRSKYISSFGAMEP